MRNRATASLARVLPAFLLAAALLQAPPLTAIPGDAISRELSLYAGSPGPVAAADAVSREFTLLAAALGPVTVGEAVAREFSLVVVETGAVAIHDAVSREFSVLAAGGERTVVSGSIAREFSVQVPTPPAILLTTGALHYVEGDGVVTIDDAARLFDPDSVHLGGGELRVELLEGSPFDRLGIGGGEAAAGVISVGEGNEVRFGDQVIGYAAGGSEGEALVVSLNEEATLAAAEALLRSITFSNATRFPAGGARLARFTLSDPDAGSGPAADREILVIPVNHPPIAGPDYLGVEQGTPLVFSLAKLLSNDHDPDGDPITLSFPVELSSEGGEVTMDGATVTYRPPAGFTGTDRFEYLLTDPYGGGATGRVLVFVRAPDDPEVSVLEAGINEAGSYALKGVGLPDRSYAVLASEDLVSWAPIGLAEADSTGELTFVDPGALLFQRRFYMFDFAVP